MKSKFNCESFIITCYVLLILIGLPLVYHNYYYDILITKYKYYYFCTLGMLVLMLITCVCRMFWIKLVQKQSFPSWKPLSNTDICVLAFGIIILISNIVSDFKYEAFWGNEGRFCGTFLLLLYISAYFCISRHLQFREWYVDIALFVGLLVCLFGLTDFFQMDLLGFKEKNSEKQRDIFTSFVGNINTYTALVSIYMGTASVLWISCKNKWKSIWYYFNMFITFLALITGLSDNAYLSLAAVFALLPLYAFQTKQGICRYVIMSASFFTSLKLVQWFSTIVDTIVIESFYSAIIQSKLFLPLLILFWIIAITLSIVKVKNQSTNETVSSILWKLWFGFLIVSFVSFLGILIDINVFGHGNHYGSVQTLLEFTDDWGTHRGYIWRIALENYHKFTPIHKLFGSGPDTFSIITYLNNLSEMSNLYGERFDCVHNEYLQYFFTIGPFGLLAYLSIFVTTIINLIKTGKNCNPYAVALLFGVIAYCAQATVNIALPIATPVIWTFLCMISSCLHKKQAL